MMRRSRNDEKTVSRLLEGYPYSPLMYIPGSSHTPFIPDKVPVNLSTTTHRILKEELFHNGALSHERSTHAQEKRDFREDVKRLLRRVPYDMLADQWLRQCTLSAEVRAYLVENILPQLVLGLEFILKEADHRKLVDKVELDPNFNPINRLAEFLMRNSPKYSNFSNLTPYARGLNDVLEALKDELFFSSDSELARLKASAEKRRIDFEKLKAQERECLEKKRAKILPIFDKFLLDGEDRVNAVAVQNAIRSFMQVVLKLPAQIIPYERPIVDVKPVEETCETYLRSEFMLYVMEYAKPLSMGIFREFTHHLHRCAREYQESINRRIKLDVMTDVFISCDAKALKDDIKCPCLRKPGYLSREKLYELFEGFAKEANERLRKNLQDPHQWPIFDYHERHEQFIAPDKSVDSYNLPDTNNSAAIETPQGPDGSTDISVLDTAMQMKLIEITGKLKDIWPDTFPTEKFNCSNTKIVTVKQFIALFTAFMGSGASIEDYAQVADYLRWNFNSSNSSTNVDNAKLQAALEAEEQHDEFNRIFIAMGGFMANHIPLLELENCVGDLSNGLCRKLLKKATTANRDNKRTLILHEGSKDSYESAKEAGKVANDLGTSRTDEVAPWVALTSSSLFLYGDALLDRTAFHRILRTVRTGLTAETGTYDQDKTKHYQDFLNCLSSVKLEASARKSMRENWISELQKVGASSDATAENVYRKTFEILQKDQDRHGKGCALRICVYLRQHDSSEVSCFAAFPETAAGALVGTTIATNSETPLGLALREGRPALGLATEYSTLALPLITPGGRTYGALQIEAPIRGILDSADFKFYLGVSNRLSSALCRLQLFHRFLPLIEAATIFVRSWLMEFHEFGFYNLDCNERSHNRVSWLLQVTRQRAEIFDVPQPIRRLAMTPSEVIFEAAESMETCVREFPDCQFVSIPIKNLYQEAIGVVCWTWLGDKPLSCEVRTRVNTITSVMQSAFWELEHCYGGGEVPGQVCCAETDSHRPDGQLEWTYQSLEHTFKVTSLNLVRDRLRSFSNKDFKEVVEADNCHPDCPSIVLEATRMLGEELPDDESWQSVRDILTPTWLDSVLRFDPFSAESWAPVDDSIKTYLVNGDGECSLVIKTINEWIQVCRLIRQEEDGRRAVHKQLPIQ
uniref:Syntaxin n=1 Tax=Schistocephalus solidus TaxID=70667 RepID=A0A0X3Q2L6_SCHSO